nr:uncharacterized protein CTRU02_08988 [Colletotrichum truncatum]KAF6789196.1 hypothetical protein CTRU02_08988 [Colletotrichum truncatum]
MTAWPVIAPLGEGVGLEATALDEVVLPEVVITGRVPPERVSPGKMPPGAVLREDVPPGADIPACVDTRGLRELVGTVTGTVAKADEAGDFGPDVTISIGTLSKKVDS